MSIILALLAALFAAMTSILAKLGIERINSNVATAVRTIVVVVMAFAIAVFTGQLSGMAVISGKAYLFLILSGLTTGLSWLCYFKAIKIGDVSKVVPIDKSSVVMTILLSFVILGEKATPLVITGCAVITIGTFILIGKVKKEKIKQPSQSYLFLAILSAVFAALTSILAKIGIEEVDSNLATFIRTVVILIFAWGIVFAQGNQKEIRRINKKEYVFLTLSGVATGLSWLCYFGAISIGNVSVVAPIDKFSVVITMVLSLVLLKEKPAKHTILGGVLITLGTILLIL
ncbi:EamA family transporter [Bacillus testis]|uniref:EamA family transporter n=1 Tax=Bacillus testis TaxID=1622072 RepID=UPI00067EB1A8|nr:EamA family transporter [Bacillus testis]